MLGSKGGEFARETIHLAWSVYQSTRPMKNTTYHRFLLFLNLQMQLCSGQWSWVSNWYGGLISARHCRTVKGCRRNWRGHIVR